MTISDHALEARRENQVARGEKQRDRKQKDAAGTRDEQRGQLDRAVELQRSLGVQLRRRAAMKPFTMGSHR